ncbi:MAG TPA: endo-1,4-beta-xylanase [Polyangiaceae bacterium]|nr:endo-1,4-beta-xylanase [Polyangiaceae bacterium]
MSRILRSRYEVGAALILCWASACTPRPDAGAPEVPREAAPSSAAESPSRPPAGGVSLAEKYAQYFSIGAAVDPGSYQTHSALLERHFNSITTENEMKFESLQKTEGKFDYSTADAMVGYARNHGMKVRGHALVWHRQTPDWVFQDGSGAPISKAGLLARLQNHISNVVGHFKGSVYAWDVVNEAIMDDGKYRTADETEADQRSKWHGILGTAYIAAAFRYAHEADPDAKLFYNEYRNYVPEKRQAVYQMLKQLLADGVPVHGVGLQCHLSIEPSSVPGNHGYYQTVKELEATIELYASLGLDVQVTELDLSLYVPGVKYTPDQYYTSATFTPELAAKQAARYGEFFDLFRKHRDVITGVTFWGVADDNTWLSEFSSGRKDFPMLFDVEHRPKPAFERVVAF